MDLRIRQIFSTDKSDIQTVSVLANTILHEFYGPQMPASHIDFFLDTYQSQEAISNHLKENWEYFLIELAEVPIGYLALNIQNDKMVLSKLYVLANQRNTGAGKAAMRVTLDRAEHHQCQIVELLVNVANERAIRFYERWGFGKIEQMRNTYDSGHTEVDYLMQKELV